MNMTVDIDHGVAVDKDERPPIPALAGYAEVVDAVANVVHSCWVREPDRRPSFASVAALLEEVWIHRGHNPASTPMINTGSTSVASTESSPADEQYETATESMTSEAEEENMDGMMDVPLTSPGPVLGNGNVLDHEDRDVLIHTPTNGLDVDTRSEETYRLLVGSNHAFHSSREFVFPEVYGMLNQKSFSVTLPLWSPTRVELGAVGYHSKSKGEFITLFNAIDPLQSCEERLRRLPSMYGYGKFEVQKREDGKRSVAQRGLDAISVFLTFKTRGDRSHPYVFVSSG